MRPQRVMKTPHDPIDIPAALRQLPLFSEITDDEIRQIATATREQWLDRGEVLFQQGDTPRGFHYVIAGQIKLGFTSRQGNEKTVEIMGPSKSFGEAVLFLDRPYPVFAQALEDSLLLHIDRHVVFALIEQDPAFCRSLLAGMAIRLHSMLRDVEDYSLHTGSQRLVSYLISLREADGEGCPAAKATVELPSSKHVIASRLNLVPETFSRILRELSENGLISVRGRKVTLKDPRRLMQLCD